MSSVTGLDERGRPTAEVRFQEIYERHYPHVRAYCRRRVAAERVDDVVAETFLTAWRRRDDLPDVDEALPWLYRVAYRVVGHQWRSNSRRRRLGDRLATARPSHASSPEDAAVQSDETARVLEAATRLKPDDAEILRLVAWEHLSRHEIAEVLDLAPNTVSKRIQRARENLRREYARLERNDERRTTGEQEGGTT